MCVKFDRSVWKLIPISGAALLAACGGGGGSSSGEPIATTSLELSPGVYSTIVEYGDGETDSGLAFLSTDGDFVHVVTVLEMTFGQLEFNGDSSISGAGTDIFFAGSVWESSAGTISGTVLTEGTAMLIASAVSFEAESTVNLEREDGFSDQGVTLPQISATFSMMGAGDVTTAITIAPDGGITGSDGTTCSFLGQLTIPDVNFNVYEVTYTATSCGESSGKSRGGVFTGLGTYDPVDGELLFAASNGEVTAFFQGAR